MKIAAVSEDGVTISQGQAAQRASVGRGGEHELFYLPGHR
jgi:hypothetical protein